MLPIPKFLIFLINSLGGFSELLWFVYTSKNHNVCGSYLNYILILLSRRDSNLNECGPLSDELGIEVMLLRSNQNSCKRKSKIHLNIYFTHQKTTITEHIYSYYIHSYVEYYYKRRQEIIINSIHGF